MPKMPGGPFYFPMLLTSDELLSSILFLQPWVLTLGVSSVHCSGTVQTYKSKFLKGCYLQIINYAYVYKAFNLLRRTSV